eukprot:9101099-Lingulodinium_polyedra.AAC.1
MLKLAARAKEHGPWHGRGAEPLPDPNNKNDGETLGAGLGDELVTQRRARHVEVTLLDPDRARQGGNRRRHN